MKDVVTKTLNTNVQQLNKLGAQIKTLPCLNIAEYVDDKDLVKFIDEYKKYKKQIYELAVLNIKLICIISKFYY